MPKDYSGDPHAGHLFTGPLVDGTPKCQTCGLVWRSRPQAPPISCPEKPLDQVFEGWGRKYG